MLTEEQVEKKCMEDYHMHEGRIILARHVHGMVNDCNVEFSLDEPVELIISPGQKENSIISWTQEGWCDPYWDVQVLFRHSDLEEASSLWVDGISRNTNGEIDRPSRWKLDPNPLTLPAVLVTKDTESRDAAIDDVLNPKNPLQKDKAEQDKLIVTCPHCKLAMEYKIYGRIGSYGASFMAQISPAKIAILEASPFKDGLYINRVNVPRGYRGQGIGSALMQEFLKAARETTLKRIIVEPGGYQSADQERRVRWYQKHGFVKHEEGYYLFDLTQAQQGTSP